MSPKQLLRPIYRAINLLYRKYALSVVKLLINPRGVSTHIILSYSAGVKSDGLGAQLQRVLALNALGEHWNIPVRHSPVKHIAVHPLDGFVDNADYLKFLDEFNELIGSDISIEGLQSFEKIYIDDLRLRHLVKLVLRVRFSKEHFILRVTHPYFFIDAKPWLYKCSANSQIQQKLSLSVTENKKHRISLHHRHGVGNLAIQPGQNKPREIILASYSNIMQTLIEAHPNMGISVYTDAPEVDLQFRPPIEQRDSWENLPEFDGDLMKVSGNSLKGLVDNLPPGTEVVRGGHPLQSLANMATSSILVLSRSSFGYVAALLSEEAEIFIPEDFWHPALPGWKTYSASRVVR